MCNLCTETREMWKKSGAWFFKTLPKYEAGNSSNDGKTDSEPSSPLSLHAPAFSRQPSNTDSRKSLSITQRTESQQNRPRQFKHALRRPQTNRQ
ncbi:unnamed protein product [Leptidea sinapis]|uniref:Uncharacterized protein n=1 Tax=Leptidea sinapis TaxID=189913 RepID=A0A5E4QEB1_9NEOP|nr:unnamed protein product [Leptidea sinapis]